MEAYLDNAATTRVFPEVREKMVRVMEEDFEILPVNIPKEWMRKSIFVKPRRF